MANVAGQAAAPRRIWLTTVDRFILRVGFGTALGFAMALVLDWKFEFLTPLIAANLLVAMPAIPSFKQGIIFPLGAIVFSNAALGAAYLFAGAPHVLFIVTGLVLCLAFYSQHRGAPAILMLLGQICFAVIAVFAMTSLELAREFADFFQKNTIAASATVWISHALIPAPPPPPRPKGAAGPGGLPPAHAARIALCDTAIIMPLVGNFMLGGDTDKSVFLTSTLIVLGQIDPKGQMRTAYERFFGQATGGVMAVVAQQFIFLADNLAHFLLTVFLGGMWFARRMVRAGPAAGFYLQALSAFILVLGLALEQGGSELYYGTRIVKLVACILYTFIGLSLLHKLRQAPGPAKGLPARS